MLPGCNEPKVYLEMLMELRYRNSLGCYPDLCFTEEDKDSLENEIKRLESMTDEILCR